jgi:NhaP-type Na+/H+ or K+/H+ antiporter
MIIRFGSVFISTFKLNLNLKERVFVFFSYLPKATVQAAIGAIPLSLGIPGGEIILGISVLSIFITAPAGAILIDLTQEKLLTTEN